MKSKKQNQKYEFLTPEEVSVLNNVNAGTAFDTIDADKIAEKASKANISSQNADTGIPSYSPADTRPYEQKNTSAGFHKSGMGTK